MCPQLSVSLSLAMPFIASCIQEQLELLQTEIVLMSWSRTGRGEVCCCIGNMAMNDDKSNLNIICGRKDLFSILFLLPKADK